MKYQVCAIEAWAGDEEGSWDVNNWFNAGVIEIGDEPIEQEIVQLMIESGHLKPAALGGVYIDDPANGTMRVCDAETHEPLYDLSLIEGGE